MIRYLFELGREKDLSRAEIMAILKLFNIKYGGVEIHDKYMILEVAEKIDPAKLMARLGGTVSLGEEIDFAGSLTDSIVNYLRINQGGKRLFSLRGNADKNAAIEIKKKIRSAGGSARYIEPKNTATILHNDLVAKRGDFIISGKKIFVTVGIQPIEEFGERDYGKPRSDSYSGMLPPKLARMMVNLAALPQTASILDPFCGSGTILMEAAHLGYKNLLGSDISAKAVADSKTNLAWLFKKIGHAADLDCKIEQADATGLHLHLEPGSIDGLITEPFLGKPLRGTESEDFLNKQRLELRELFIGSFRSFARVLRPGGVTIFVIPAYKINGKLITIDLLSEVEKIGFRSEDFSSGQPFLRYARPDQLVERNIWKFIFTG